MVIGNGRYERKTTIIRKASKVIAAVVIILEVIETIDRTIQVVRENRETLKIHDISRMNRDNKASINCAEEYTRNKEKKPTGLRKEEP